MHFMLGEFCIETQHYGTLGALQEFMGSLHLESGVLGDHSPVAGQFYVLYTHHQKNVFGVEFSTHAEALAPHVLMLPLTMNVMIGYGSKVTTVHWPTNRVLRTSSFMNNPLTRIIHFPEQRHIVVTFEHGLIGLSEDGNELWRREFSDIVNSIRIVDDVINISLGDSNVKKSLWLCSGNDLISLNTPS